MRIRITIRIIGCIVKRFLVGEGKMATNASVRLNGFEVVMWHRSIAGASALCLMPLTAKRHCVGRAALTIKTRLDVTACSISLPLIEMIRWL